ncbi:transcriptional regulator, partial [Halobacteriales archaeon SW_12_69_24]
MSDQNAGVEAWKEHTTAFDRVRSVGTTVSRPRPASYVADEAHVAENTARDHLERLVNLNVLLKTERDGGTLYSPDPLHVRIQTVRDLLEEHDRDGLI